MYECRMIVASISHIKQLVRANIPQNNQSYITVLFLGAYIGDLTSLGIRSTQNKKKNAEMIDLNK